MSKFTPNYKFVYMDTGDVWYPGYDKRNMQTSENQIQALMHFVGPGVMSGWEVTKGVPLDERVALINATSSSDLTRYTQYMQLEQPEVDDDVAWNQVVRISTGGGIVGLFRAETIEVAYIRLKDPNKVFYVWAEAGLCLTTDGKVQITIPLDGYYDHNTRATATYLATVTTTETVPGNEVSMIYEVTYDLRRKSIKNLAGALDEALRKSFYRHVHLGGTEHPSKINLSTYKRLQATSTVPGSTIFLVTDNGVIFTWNPQDYGIPKVTLNELQLDSSEYTLQPGTGRILLRNSILPTDILQLILPLSPQVNLTIHPSSRITDSIQDVLAPNPIFLTDGQLGTDGQPRIYKWDSGVHKNPQVFLKGNQIESGYTILPTRGAINFDPALILGTYEGTDLRVLLTKIGDEIEGKLPGSRTDNINAATFLRGQINPSRLSGLDHVGAIRYMESAKVRPSLRWFPFGDGTTYYAEDAGQALQFGYTIKQIVPSLNFNPSVVLGTTRGMFQTSTLSTTTEVAGWLKDRGQPIFICDDVLQASPGTNRFYTTFVLTEGGNNVSSNVYYTKNNGVSWTALRKPVVDSAAIDPTAFIASTDRNETNTSLFLRTFEWSSIRHYGTAQGLFSATVQEGAPDEDWAWSYEEAYGSTQVYALSEITTLRQTTTTDANGSSTTTEDYDRTLYVGNGLGLYVGTKHIDFAIGAEPSVRGIYWIRQGGAQNNLMWFTDNDVYFTNTANLVSDSSANSSSSYWNHPLTQVPTNAFSDVRLATTENLTTFTLTEIDSITLATNDRVLVHNQSTLSENGIYIYNGTSLVRDADDLIAGDMYVKVSSGSTLGGSAWKLPVHPDGFVLGSSDVVWTNLWYRIARSVDAKYRGAVQKPATDQFVIWSTSGSVLKLSLTYTSSVLNTPIPTAISWVLGVHGVPNTSCYLQDGTGTFLAIGGDKGAWISRDDGVTFKRAREVFSRFSTIRIYDEKTLTQVPLNEYDISATGQSVIFTSVQNPWDEFIFEKDFKRYYLDRPWLSDGTDVIVYINDEISVIPYELNADLGYVQFTASLSPLDTVKITLVRNGAYIANTGNTPHEELPKTTIVSSQILTTTSDPLLPSDLVLSVRDFSSIPVSTTMLELRYNQFKERVSIVVDTGARVIRLVRPRTGLFTFPSSTKVYSVSIESVLGIEDEISRANSNQTYHLNSLIGDNVIQLSLAKDNGTLYTNYATSPAFGYENQADRGAKQALFIDLSDSSQFDEAASSSGIIESLEPTSDDSATSPRSVYAFKNASLDGSNMEVGTDQGIWAISNGHWVQQSSLDNSKHVYYINNNLAGKTIAGTEKGVFTQQVDKSWVANPLFPQANFAHITGSWYDGTIEAYGKSDGIAAAVVVGDQDFQSDHFDVLGDHNVYGLWLGKFFRLEGDPPTRNEFDALYTCTEVGLFGLTDGGRPGQYSGFFKGRDMFGDTYRQLLNGSPVKFYKIFQAPPRPRCDSSEPTPTIPILILSNNGVYRVRNWRWCDPADAAGLNFYPEVHALAGTSCTCFATTTRACAPNVEPLSKCFIGTEYGVYRSYDEGASWQRCERLGGNDIPVNTLEIVDGCMIAGTSEGIYTSDDDGDSWTISGDDNSCTTFDFDMGEKVKFSTQYLAMSFRPPDNTSHVSKIGAFLESAVPHGASDPSAFAGSYVLPSIWTVDANGVPLAKLTDITAPQPIYFNDVKYPNFWHANVDVALPVVNTTPSSNVRYALVLTEYFGIGTDGLSGFRWFASRSINRYPNGEAYLGTGIGPSWSPVQGLTGSMDFFFRVFLNAPSQATPTVHDLDFESPDEGRGFILNDAGYLTTDTKFALAIVVDDSSSQSWSDDGNKPVEFTQLINTLFDRTRPSDSPPAFYPSFADIYTFGIDVLDKTIGYTNDIYRIRIILNSMFNRGTASDLYTSCTQAFSSLEPQGVIDAIMLLSVDQRTIAVNQIVEYMNHSSRQILRLEALKAWFISQPESSRSSWPVLDDGLGNPINSPGFSDNDLIDLISQYDDVSNYTITRWANSFTPLAIVVGDGDNNGSSTASEAITSAQSAWQNSGIQVVTIGTGNDHNQAGLRSLASETGGIHANIANGQNNGDWDLLRDSLVQEGENSRFAGYWTKTVDFETPTYVASTLASFDSNGGVCLVKIRWTADRINWSNWIDMSSGIAVDFNAKILGIEYSVTLKDGWNNGNSSPLKPVVQSISYTTVSPGIEYFITTSKTTNGMIFEYLLSSESSLPSTAEMSWGIVRGDSSDFFDFESIFMGRKGCLANRQHSIQFTDLIVRDLGTRTSDFLNYTILDNELPALWSSEDIIQVFINNFEIDPSVYSLDRARSLIIFQAQQPAGATVTAIITTPSRLVDFDGEPMTTFDNRTYFAVNGRWPHDAIAVVFVNGIVRRGGFWTDNTNGLITFFRELDSTDIVTIYIQFSTTFRLGAMLKKYSDDAITMNNVGMYYTVLPNRSVLFEYTNPKPPSVVPGTLKLNPSSASIYDRMQVDYQYNSPDGSHENNTNIQWWRLRNNDPNQGTYTTVDADGYARLYPLNGFTDVSDYENRTVERTIHIGNVGGIFSQGDKVYVTVSPSNGFSSGLTVASKPAITLTGTHAPYAYDLTVLAPGKQLIDGVWYIQANTEITAGYSFNDIDGGNDLSVIKWYNENGITPFATGATIPASQVVSGLTLHFDITPYDGQQFGNTISSEYVTIR